MFWRKRNYSEAYLEIKRNKITATEKTRREELGDDSSQHLNAEKKSETIQVVTPIPEESPYEKENNQSQGEREQKESDETSPYEEEDERVVERPKRRLAWGMLVFWVLFIVVTLQFFQPNISRTLEQTIDYTTFSRDSWFSRDLSVREDMAELGQNIVEQTEDVTSDAGTQWVDRLTEQLQETSPGLADSTQQALEFAQNEFSTDELRVYARAHRIIRETTHHVRNTTQRYVLRKGQYVEIVALEGRILADNERVRQMLRETENTAIKAILLARVDRLDDLSSDVRQWDRKSAVDEANAFVRAENQDSDAFISMLKTRLNDEGRSYHTEDGVIYFD